MRGGAFNNYHHPMMEKAESVYILKKDKKRRQILQPVIHNRL